MTMLPQKIKQWSSEEMAEFTEELELDLDSFDMITCRVCKTTYPLTSADWLDGVLPCPRCGYVEGENFE